MVSLTRALAFFLLLKFVKMAVPGSPDNGYYKDCEGQHCEGNKGAAIVMKHMANKGSVHRVTGIRLQDTTASTTVKDLYECARECNGVKCVVFSYDYISKACSVAFAWEESGPLELYTEKSNKNEDIAFFMWKSDEDGHSSEEYLENRQCFSSVEDLDDFQELHFKPFLFYGHTKTPAIPVPPPTKCSSRVTKKPTEKGTLSTTAKGQEDFSSASRASNPTADTPISGFSYTPAPPVPPTISTLAWQAITDYFFGATEEQPKEDHEREHSTNEASGHSESASTTTPTTPSSSTPETASETASPTTTTPTSSGSGITETAPEIGSTSSTTTSSSISETASETASPITTTATIPSSPMQPTTATTTTETSSGATSTTTSTSTTTTSEAQTTTTSTNPTTTSSASSSSTTTTTTGLNLLPLSNASCTSTSCSCKSNEELRVEWTGGWLTCIRLEMEAAMKWLALGKNSNQNYSFSDSAVKATCVDSIRSPTRFNETLCPPPVVINGKYGMKNVECGAGKTFVKGVATNGSICEVSTVARCTDGFFCMNPIDSSTYEFKLAAVVCE